MTITKQARARKPTMRELYEAARKAGQRSAEGRTFEEWESKVSDFGLDDARQAYEVYSHVQPATVTEAIEEVKRLRNGWQYLYETEEWCSEWGDKVQTATQIIAALESLQGKAGVNQQAERLFFCPYCRTPISCDGVGHKVNAATTPASVEAPVGTEEKQDVE